MDDLARTALRTAGGLAGAGLVGIAYAAFVERTWFTLRRFAVPALPRCHHHDPQVAAWTARWHDPHQ